MNIPEITISGEKLFELFGINVTSTFLAAPIIAAGIFFLFAVGFSKAKIIPSKIQNFLEMILEFLYDFSRSITGDEKIAKEIFPIAATFFVFILTSNLMELIPGLGIFHFLRSPSSDLNFTFALSLFAITFINVSAIRKLGPISYLKKYINFKSPIGFFLGILEAIGEITRILSLAFRLFGNLFAGEVLLIIASFLFAYLLPLPFLLLEILVGFIQAAIFFSLVVIFYSTAVKHEHE